MNLVNYFGRGVDRKISHNLGSVNIIQCQLCNLEKHHLCIPKLTNLRPKCAKCGVGHKTENYGLKCFFCSNMGHTKNRCWRKNGKVPSTFAIFLEILINVEEVTLTELNWLYEIKHNVFLGVHMPKRKMHVQAFA